MLASIHPLGERARRNRFGVTATAFTLASLGGGVTLGAVAAMVGAGLRAAGFSVGGVATGIVAVAAAGAFVVDATAWLPTFRRQVDERWLDTYRGWVYGAGFGFQ